MYWFASPIALYAVMSLAGAVAAFGAGRRFRVDTEAASTKLFALVAGLVWPVLLVGLLQLAIVHAAARLLRYVDGLADPSVLSEKAPLGAGILMVR